MSIGAPCINYDMGIREMPADNAIEHYLDKLIEQMPSVGANPLIFAFLRTHGRRFRAQSLPIGYRRGKQKQCFHNAIMLSATRGLLYVEGLALSANAPDCPLEHAWCVDSAGNVIDNTWKRGLAYFGVPLKTEFVKRLTKERAEREGDSHLGKFIDDYESGFALVAKHGAEPELWLHDVARGAKGTDHEPNKQECRRIIDR